MAIAAQDWMLSKIGFLIWKAFFLNHNIVKICEIELEQFMSQLNKRNKERVEAIIEELKELRKNYPDKKE